MENENKIRTAIDTLPWLNLLSIGPSGKGCLDQPGDRTL